MMTRAALPPAHTDWTDRQTDRKARQQTNQWPLPGVTGQTTCSTTQLVYTTPALDTQNQTSLTKSALKAFHEALPKNGAVAPLCIMHRLGDDRAGDVVTI